MIWGYLILHKCDTGQNRTMRCLLVVHDTSSKPSACGDNDGSHVKYGIQVTCWDCQRHNLFWSWLERLDGQFWHGTSLAMSHLLTVNDEHNISWPFVKQFFLLLFPSFFTKQNLSHPGRSENSHVKIHLNEGICHLSSLLDHLS